MPQVQTQPVDGDELFDPEWNLLLQVGYGHLNHTRIAPGVEAHRTRESLEYAVRLLKTGDESRYPRAHDVIRAVLKVQDIEPTSATFGLWPWYAEEPLPQMSRPDYNWAEFCGSTLAEALILCSDRLPDDLTLWMREALHRACLCIFRRNVGPGYTNISLLGGVAMAAAGEVLGDRCWLDYGRQRLADLLKHTNRFEGFSEFNSPTYTLVVVTACELLLRTVRDPASVETASTLLGIAWEQIAESFHAPTGQWAGAQSRSYHDLLAPHIAQALADRTGVTLLGDRGSVTKPRDKDNAPPCPPHLIKRFSESPVRPTRARRYVNRAAQLLDGVDIVTTIWMDGQRTLGTVSAVMTWHQSRQVQGFWRVGDAIARCRARVLKDGKDFAAGWLWAAQSDRNVLAAMSFCDDLGPWNGWSDRPADGVHPLEDLRMRLEVVGPGVIAETDAEGFVLRCGEQRLVARPAAGQFMGKDITWEAGQAGDHAWVDAVLHTGRPMDFNPATQEQPAIALGCSLAGDGETIPAGSPRMAKLGSDRYHWAWDDAGLSLTAARRPFGMTRIW